MSDLAPAKVEDAVIGMIRRRGEVGRMKYQQTMDRVDLHPDQWLQHLQEELADGLQYAERVKGLTQLLREARQIMLSLVHERDWECASQWIARHDQQFLPSASPPAF